MIRDLSMAYSGAAVLSRTTFELARGSPLLLLGPPQPVHRGVRRCSDRVDERNPTVISGTLELTGQDESGVFYRLRNARPG